MRLEGKVAIITGAAGSMGAEEARLFAREGAKVVIADVFDDDGRQVEAEIAEAGGEAIYVHADVTGEDDWDRHFAVNTKGVLFCSQAAAHQMIDQGHGGRIITIVSTAGVLPSFRDTYVASYVASKHATMGLIRQMGQEIAPHGILMNAVFPGIVDTDMLRRLALSFADTVEAGYEILAKDAKAQRRIADPSEIAGPVLYLASDLASFVTGATHVVDGGEVID